MFIEITKSACGLVVGKSYNLCDQAANDLINKGQAKAITAKSEVKKAEKQESQRNADKKVAKLSGNLAIVAEKATKAAKDAVEAVEAAKKAQQEAEEALKKVQDEAAAAADGDKGDNDAGLSIVGSKYGGDFSEFTDDEVKKMADDAGLPDNVTNPGTIRKKLIEASFDPLKKDDDDTE